MHPILRLYEDTISGGTAAMTLPALPRMIFLVHGSVGNRRQDASPTAKPGTARAR